MQRMRKRTCLVFVLLGFIAVGCLCMLTLCLRIASEGINVNVNETKYSNVKLDDLICLPFIHVFNSIFKQ